MSQETWALSPVSALQLICCSAMLAILPVAASAQEHTRIAENTFTRMFPGLTPFAPVTDEMREQAKRLGQQGGVMDALDLSTDPIQSIVNPAVFSPNNPDNPTMTAGMTFLGQFIDHDLTLAPRSPLLEPADPRRTTNFRTTAFDLDSVYGNGPEGSPELYDRSSGDIKFRVEVIPGSETVSRKGAVRYDLPRGANNTALIGDGRNDENVVISQLHLAMLRFHNAVVDRLRGTPMLAILAIASPEQLFQMAQRQVRWHYQWIVLNEFLPLTIGPERVADILQNGTKFYTIDDPFSSNRFRDRERKALIPIEWAVAAYRFGHSQVRPSYRLNFGSDGGSPFFAFAFDDTFDPDDPDPGDLRGGSAHHDGSSIGKRSLISATGMRARIRRSTSSYPAC